MTMLTGQSVGGVGDDLNVLGISLTAGDCPKPLFSSSVPDLKLDPFVIHKHFLDLEIYSV